MLGAIAGDVIGSIREVEGLKTKQFYGGVPDHIAGPVRERLDDHIEEVLNEFTERYGTRLRR